VFYGLWFLQYVSYYFLKKFVFNFAHTHFKIQKKITLDTFSNFVAYLGLRQPLDTFPRATSRNVLKNEDRISKTVVQINIVIQSEKGVR
jgi:hypothetical protein